MRVAIYPSDFDGPGSYRILWPADELRKHGHEVVMPKFEITGGGRNRDPNVDNSTFLSIAMQTSPDLEADVYVLQMPHEANYVGLAKYWRAKGKVVVCETDDDQLNLPLSHPAWWGTHEQNPAAKDRNRFYLREAFKHASLVTCSTPSLAKTYSEFCPNTVVLPNYLYWPWWKDVPQQYEIDRGGRVRVGWMGRTFWRPEDIAVMKEIVGTVLGRNPQVDFVAAGDAKLHDMLEVPEERRVTLPAVDFRDRKAMLTSKLPEITASMDIGLVPLAQNTFNEGKSYLKGMEYAACGIPCVATPTGPYRSWVDSANGLLADSPAEWVQAIETLLDFETRQRMGRAARKKAERFRIDKHWQEWANAYLGSVMESRGIAA